MSGSCRFVFVLLAAIVFTSGLAATGVRAQSNGVLGIFFDDRADNCSAKFTIGTSRTLYVLLLPEGDTRGGITTAEFSIDASGASGYSFSSEQVMGGGSAIFGPAVGPGLNVFYPSCKNGLPIALLSLKVTNLSGGADAVVEIAAKSPPLNPNFDCPLVTLCDSPAYTKVCIMPDRAVFNPTGALRCGIASEKSDWGRVKELYR